VTKQLLKHRLTSHRTTHARLKLLGILEFTNSDSTIAFEKQILQKLQINRLFTRLNSIPIKKGVKLEQFEIKIELRDQGLDFEKIFSSEVEQFASGLNSLIPNYVKHAEDHLIVNYNQDTILKLGPPA